MKPTRETCESRVAVAKDALLQLRRQDVPFNVMPSQYFKWQVDLSIPPGDDLREHVDAVQKNCRVCALGALLLSYSRLHDGVVPMASLFPQDYNRRREHYVDGACETSLHRVTIGLLLRPLFDDRTTTDIDRFFEGRSYAFINPEGWAKYLAEVDGEFAGFDQELAEITGDFASMRTVGASRMKAICENIVANDGEFLIPFQYRKHTPCG